MTPQNINTTVTVTPERKKELRKSSFKTAGLGILIATAFLLLFSLTSCNKDYNDRDYPTPPPIEQTVSQSFGMQIDSKVTPMNQKGWNKNLWVYNYSTKPFTMTLTGTDNSNVYTKSVTVAELKAGTVTFQMLAGSYHVTFETIHEQSLNPWSLNGETQAALAARAIGDVLDIKIDQTVTITGSPANLTATLQDALIIIDIPTSTEVKAFWSEGYLGSVGRLLKNSTDLYHFGYVNSSKWLDITFSDGPNKRLPMNTLAFGNAYHVVSPFGATVALSIPDMIVNTVVLP